MTHFVTESGVVLGATFCGDNGRTFHATKKEVADLFNLSLEVKVWADNETNVKTVRDLLNLFVKTPKASKEEMNRRWKMKLCESFSNKN